jgi:flap endonuclease-1
MGISDFRKLLQLVPGVLQKTEYGQCGGQAWAIDASIFCYRFSHNKAEKGENAHINGFYQLFARLLKNGIQPVVVLDGKAPPHKAHTIAARKSLKLQNKEKVAKIQDKMTTIEGQDGPEGKGLIQQLSAEMEAVAKNIVEFAPTLFHDLYTLCELMGIRVIKATGEADSLCAKLYNTGQVQGILSEDSDILLYRGGCLLSKFSWLDQLDRVYLSDLMTGLGLDYNQFVDLCLLCGTDYTQGKIEGIGAAKALQYIRSGLTVEQLCAKITDKSLPEASRYQIPGQWLEEYRAARQLILTAHEAEPEVKIEPFDVSRIQFAKLSEWLLSKRNYRPTTIQNHYSQMINARYLLMARPKMKLKLKTKITLKVKDPGTEAKEVPGSAGSLVAN